VAGLEDVSGQGREYRGVVLDGMQTRGSNAECVEGDAKEPCRVHRTETEKEEESSSTSRLFGRFNERRASDFASILVPVAPRGRLMDSGESLFLLLRFVCRAVAFCA